MKTMILFIYLFILNGLVTSDSCDCCDKCPNSWHGSCPEIKYVEGGASGEGGLSRYWNCCKPNCASEEQAAKGNQARQCNAYMHRLYDYSTKSKCEGGTATTCFSQSPFVIDGCDNIGFGFATVGAKSSDICGRCFLIEFTGEGYYTTKDNHRKLKNKKLILMAIHRGYADYDGQGFNLLVPGGGHGMYETGCVGIFSGDEGAKYGGLLQDCQGEAGMYDGEEGYNARKDCLIRKCKENFTDEVREGCLFYANFLEAAGNPSYTFKEVECPQILKDRY